MSQDLKFCLPRLVAGDKVLISWKRLESIYKFLCLYLPRYLKRYPEILSFHHQHRCCSRFVDSKTEIRATSRVILVSRQKYLQDAVRHTAACRARDAVLKRWHNARHCYVQHIEMLQGKSSEFLLLRYDGCKKRAIPAKGLKNWFAKHASYLTMPCKCNMTCVNYKRYVFSPTNRYLQ